MQNYQDDLGNWHVLPDQSFAYLLTQNNPERTFIAKTQADYDAAQALLVPTLAQVQAMANAAIDAQAGATRLKYITDVAGQSETYLSKANDAAAYKAAGYPSAAISNYPMVQAEAKALNGATPTVAQYQAAADGILTQQEQWIALAAAIEQQRRGGKIAVGNATTVAGIQAAQQAAIAALQAL